MNVLKKMNLVVLFPHVECIDFLILFSKIIQQLKMR